MILQRFALTATAAALVFSFNSFAAAQEYYVDPEGSDGNPGTSPESAWQTLAPVEDMGWGSSGYTVNLKAGGQWTTGGLNVNGWTLQRYDAGPNPVLVGDGSGWGGPITAGNNAVVDGITVRGQGSTAISVQGPNAVVRNCEVDGSEGYFQLGFGIMGDGNLVTGNSVHDLSGMSGDSGDMNTSGGAEAYMVMGSNNEISYNSAINCWGPNETLGGAEGGCLEIVNGEALATIENVRFHHNYCERSVGLFEGCSGNFQGTDAIQENHGIIRDSVIAYNISVDAMWLYLLQPVNTDFYNLVFEHNTLVHTPANADIPQGGADSFGLLVNDDQGYSADPLQPGMVIVRNNLFFTTGGGSGMMTEVPDHTNNLFAPSAPMSWTLGTGEVAVADPGLTADYRLVAGSPAIDVGSPEAWQQWTDFDGNAVPLGNGRDIGASEYCDGANCAEPVDLGTGGSGSTGSGGADSGPTCEGSLTLCGEACVDTTSDGAHCGGCNNACPAGQVCSAGACVTGGCPAGQVECNQGCVDTATNALHCGECGAACMAGQTCVGGVCTGTPTGGSLADPIGDGGDESSDDGGCGCTVPAANKSLTGMALGVLLGLLALGRRRRPRV